MNINSINSYTSNIDAIALKEWIELDSIISMKLLSLISEYFHLQGLNRKSGR